MTKNRVILASAAVCLLIAGVIAVGLTRDRAAKPGPGVPDTEDSRSIQETILRSYEIRCQAILTGDTSAFASVFVNDPRGGPLSPNQLTILQTVTGDFSKTDFGYLDWKIEDYTIRPTPEVQQTPVSPPDGTPRLKPTAPPARRVPCRRDPLEIKFLSVVVDGDQAVATFDIQGCKSAMMMVKIEGQWLIAGFESLSMCN